MRLALLSVAALCAATMGQALECPRFEILGWAGNGATQGAPVLAEFEGGPRIATERNVISAKLGMDANGQPSVAIKLDAEAKKALAAHTAEHLFEPLALVIDGTLVTAPRIQSSIEGGAVMMSGLGSYDAAKAAIDALISDGCPPETGD